jgi:hypothetical protein
VCDPISDPTRYRALASSQPWRASSRFRVDGPVRSGSRFGFACAGTKPAKVLLQHAATGGGSAMAVPPCVTACDRSVFGEAPATLQLVEGPLL